MSVLSGLRVIEFSAFVSAPLAGATLASLGAEVIRIEQKGGSTHGDGRSMMDAASIVPVSTMASVPSV